jgi:hypothetical protein
VTDLQTVLAWLDAVNRRNAAMLFALSAETITFFGPKGAAGGHERLRRWFDEVRFRATPKAALRAGGRILVLHESVWFGPDGNRIGGGQSGAVFTVENGRVTSYLRDDSPDPVRRQGFRGATELPLPQTP